MSYPFGTLGATLRAARLAARYTLREAARAIGTSHVTIHDIELGRRPGSARVLGLLADIYGLDTLDLLSQSGRLDAQTVLYLKTHRVARAFLRTLVVNEVSDERLQQVLQRVEL